MRRIARIDRSLGFLNSKAATTLSSPYLCAVCRSRENRFSTSSIQKAQDGRLEKGLDKLRRKIWGSDKPPGLDNPYGDGSIFEERTRQRQEKDKVTTESQLSTRAPKQPKAAKVDSSYEPAETWDGLESVGGCGNWWLENWDPKHPFRSFVPAEVETRDIVITTCLHRAMVEVFAVQQAGKALSTVSLAAPKEDITLDIQMLPSPGGVTLQFPESASLAQLLDTLSPNHQFNHHEIKEQPTLNESKDFFAAGSSTPDLLQPESTQHEGDETATKEAPTESEEDVAADRSTVDPLQSDKVPRYYEDIVAAWDPSWLQISLENAGVKFAILKRMMQLTGIRIPDSVISSANTSKALLAHLVTPPKPRKLVQFLEKKENLMTLPNVAVYPSRITPVDRERSVGRWKVIEKELQERGLPVLGR